MNIDEQTKKLLLDWFEKQFVVTHAFRNTSGYATTEERDAADAALTALAKFIRP